MKTIFEEFNGTYRQAGDYLVPDIKCPENANTGIWGQRRARYLRAETKVLYFNMLTNGTLDDHLEEIDKSAGEMFERLVQQMKFSEGVTERLKADFPLEWVSRMNNIRNRAEEIILREMIYGEDAV